ncbi:MAG: hypothetical protein JWO86_1396 [Myxococcaceae bacterium]|nr:hypothetical protein [Myxococcaceae bacterium]
MRLAVERVVLSHPYPMNVLRTALTSFAFLGTFALTQPAFADGNGAKQQDGARQDLVGEAERWLAAATAGPTAASDPSNHGGVAREGASTAEREVAKPNAIGAEQQALIDFSSPTLSVVARDWHGSMRIMGDRTLVLDDLRATSSNRMVVTRLATDARLSTFVQMGVGEWRIDPAMFPTARSYSEVAGQIGSGFELRLSSRARIAAEATYTALYRDLHYTSDEVAPRILAFAVAIDGRF